MTYGFRQRLQQIRPPPITRAMIDNSNDSATCLLETQDVNSTNRGGVTTDDLAVCGGNKCSECGMPGEDLENSWCQHCGYFAKYGTTVDLDIVEAASEPTPFPTWIKKAGIIAGVAFLGSIAARFALGPFPTVHMVVGTTQLIVGLGVFMALHSVGFLHLVLTDSGVKLMDLLNPYGIWAPVFAKLPDTEKKILIAWAGVCVGFGALLTGGQPTSWLEFKETVIVMEEEPEEEGDGGGGPRGAGDLESAVKDFAKKGTRAVQMPGDQAGAGVAGGEAVDETETIPAEPEEEEEEEWLDAECVIIGYLPQLMTDDSASGVATEEGESGEPGKESAGETEGAEGEEEREGVADGTTEDPATPKLPGIRALVVASQVGPTLCVVGYVSEGVTPAVANDLLRQFQDYHRDSPFVRCEAAGVWLQPKFVCNIKYKLWDPKAGLLEPKFDKILQVLP